MALTKRRLQPVAKYSHFIDDEEKCLSIEAAGRIKKLTGDRMTTRSQRNRNRVRYRGSCTNIPYLDYFYSPRPSEGRFDLIKIKFEGVSVRASDTGTINQYLLSLTESDLFQADGLVNQYHTIKVRRGWLFGGTAKLKNFRTRPSPNPESDRRDFVADFELQLELNLTRFLAFTDLSYQEILNADPNELLRIDTERNEQLAASTLDGATNILSDEKWVASEEQEDFFILYLTKVQELINFWLQGYAGDHVESHSAELDNYDIRIEGNWNRFVIQRAEVYHEYVLPRHALPHVRSLAMKATAIVSNTDIAEYDRPRAITQNRFRYRTKENAISVSFNLGRQNVNLMVYAKTPDRVRFEVRYTQSLQTAFNSSVDYRVSDLEHHRERMRQLLDIARQDAANNCLRHVYRAFQRVSVTRSPSLASLSSLMKHISAVCGGDENRIQEVLDLLLTQGGISRPKETRRALYRIVNRLKNRGVLQRESPVERCTSFLPRYCLTEEYASTVNAMREALETAAEEQ